MARLNALLYFAACAAVVCVVCVAVILYLGRCAVREILNPGWQ